MHYFTRILFKLLDRLSVGSSIGILILILVAGRFS